MSSRSSSPKKSPKSASPKKLAKKSSPKKTSPKKSPPKVKKETIHSVLYKLDPKSLIRMCKSSPEIKKICSESWVLTQTMNRYKEYVKLHKGYKKIYYHDTI